MKQARADQECLEHENMRPSVKWRPSDYEAFCCLSTSKFMCLCVCVVVVVVEGGGGLVSHECLCVS